MKDPKVVFPYVFASSWLGNLLLTVLAFYLAFSQQEPLSPLVLFSVAVCILSGNLLPIGTWYLMIHWRRAELEAESAQASVHVREALRRSEEVMGRLDEAEGALSKVLLVARQVPERIAEQQRPLSDLLERLDTLEVEAFTETLSEQAEGLTEVRQALSSLKERITALSEGLHSLPAKLKSELKALLPDPVESSPDSDVSVDERLDLVYESLESVQDSLDGLLERIAQLGQASPASVAASPAKAKEEVPVELSDPQEEASEVGTEGEAADPDQPSVEEVQEPETTDPANGAEDPIPAEPIEESSPVANTQEEMQLGGFADSEPDAEEGRDIPADVVEVTIQAMIGISNKLFIRGDEPWLSWDEGQVMELIGIGEFAWRGENIKEPIEVSILLNDEIETEAGRFTLEPGKAVRARLQFPRN